MHRAALPLILILFLSACSGARRATEAGSMLPPTDSSVQKRMAGDFAARIAALYPAARTKLKLTHDTSDAFGTNLVESLRKKGYAITEFAGHRWHPAAGKANESVSEIGLAYVVDQPLDTNTIRVTVFFNTQSLSRLYERGERGGAPAGFWVRKE